MKSRLVVLSDLWGKSRSSWWGHYAEKLQDQFEMQFYDCCELGEVSTQKFTQEELHQQFVGGGIERAAQNLSALEKHPVHLLGFSVGGTIGWKACLESLEVNSFFGVSATRLRHERQPISSKVELWFGEEDVYRPNAEWFRKMKASTQVLSGHGHRCYMDLEVANAVVRQFLSAKK